MVRLLTPAARLVAVAALACIPPACSLGDEEVCGGFADDVVRLTARSVDAAGTASTGDLPATRVDELRTELTTGLYEVEVQRDQLGCDRGALAEQVCPRLVGIEPTGPFGDELLASVTDGYDCEA